MLKNVPTIGGGQATRTWVSGVGDDANPCSRTAPCKTFAGAISKTALGGEIDALDPGGFGAVTITKSITIDGNGTFASILAAGVNGIVVNAGVNDVVTLRNLSIDGAGTGINGIRFLAGAALHVENCVLFNFTARAIDFQPSGNAILSVKDTVIRNCKTPVNGGGIFVGPGAAGTAQGFLDNVLLQEALFGILVNDRSVVTVRNSVATRCVNSGFSAISAATFAILNLESCVASQNTGGATPGVFSSGANGTVRMSNCLVVDNGAGLSVAAGGRIFSFGNNHVTGNTTNGAPTPPVIGPV